MVMEERHREPDDPPEPSEERREPLEQLEEDAAERNPDEITRRETLELDLMERDRSDEGEEIGEEID
jgi:hypothetical protein